MANATGEAKRAPMRAAFDLPIKLKSPLRQDFCNGGLFAYRELDNTFLTLLDTSTLAQRPRGQKGTGRLATEDRVNALAGLCGKWVDRGLVAAGRHHSRHAQLGGSGL